MFGNNQRLRSDSVARLCPPSKGLFWLEYLGMTKRSQGYGFQASTRRPFHEAYAKYHSADLLDLEDRMLTSISTLCMPSLRPSKHLCRTNSKATVRLAASKLLPLMPSLLHAPVKASRHYASRTDSLVIQSDSSRKQMDNVEECFRKLHDFIVDIGESSIKGETSTQQITKVKKL